MDRMPGMLSTPPLKPGIQAVALLSGLALTLAGSVAVFTTDNSAGAAAMVTSGVVVMVLALLGNHMQAFEAGGIKLSFIREAAAQLEAAQTAEADGDATAAAQHREQAEQLLAAAEGVATKYDLVRSLEPSSWDRTSRLEGLLREARELDIETATAETVAKLFDSGIDGQRITALALVQANPSLGEGRVLRLALDDPRSAFEQYQALVATRAAWSELGSGDRQTIRRTVERLLDENALGDGGSDRRRLAKALLSLPT